MSLGMPPGEATTTSAGASMLQVAALVVDAHAFAMRLQVVAGHGVQHALVLVEHHVEDEVDADQAAGLVDVVAHRVAPSTPARAPGLEHHGVVVADGGVRAHARHDGLGPAGKAGEVVVLDVAGADAQVGVEIWP